MCASARLTSTDVDLRLAANWVTQLQLGAGRDSNRMRNLGSRFYFGFGFRFGFIHHRLNFVQLFRL